MAAKYRYSADKGTAIPVETDEERTEREEREWKAIKDEEWKAYLDEREKRTSGPYL